VGSLKKNRMDVEADGEGKKECSSCSEGSMRLKEKGPELMSRGPTVDAKGGGLWLGGVCRVL